MSNLRSTTKLILLPGMDGTGRLMEPFAEELGAEFEPSIIRLPSGDDQSYAHIVRYVRGRLPTNDRYILLAESFSGPIAYRLLQDNIENIVSVIFVATFIRRPNFLLTFSPLVLPHLVLWRSPIATLAVKVFLTGFRCGRETIENFWAAFDEAGVRAVRRWLTAVSRLPRPTARISKRCFYIQAEFDHLVPPHNFRECEKLFDNIELHRIRGPHLILQTRPKECAEVVREIAVSLR